MRPHRFLEGHLRAVEMALAGLSDAYVESYVEELLTPLRANLKIRVRFNNGRLLEISEALALEDDSLKHLDYRYHCQDGSNRLVFRYDSAPHFPDLPTYPEHKHLPKATISCPRPSIARVLAEATAIEPAALEQ
jgi:hypothetical protein